jgi:hypothetical protein
MSNATDRDAGLEIRDVPRHGMPMQRTTLTVTINGVTREVEVERFSPHHCWGPVSVRDFVVVRFPTGSKEHVQCPTFGRANGNSKWVASVQGFRNANRCYVVRWATEQDRGSGWTPRG